MTDRAEADRDALLVLVASLVRLASDHCRDDTPETMHALAEAMVRAQDPITAGRSLLSSARTEGWREGVEAAAFECEDRARVSELAIVQSGDDLSDSDTAWYRSRAERDRQLAARIRSLPLPSSRTGGT